MVIDINYCILIKLDLDISLEFKYKTLKNNNI